MKLITCSVCGYEKLAKQFSKANDTSLRPECKKCYQALRSIRRTTIEEPVIMGFDRFIVTSSFENKMEKQTIALPEDQKYFFEPYSLRSKNTFTVGDDQEKSNWMKLI